MTAASTPHVSFVLATYNRKEPVTHTLAQLARCGLDRADYEVIVVDNASSDGTPDDIAPRCDVLIRRPRNAGSCAKAYGVERARGQYIVFLDDDSFPRPGSAERMLRHFESDQSLGAAGFTVHLPDGRLEGGALPDVFVGCGVGLRIEALRQAGGLDASFFMQAEEYDLAFRLASAGWGIQTFDDLHVEHRKTECARRSERTLFYDIRNNLRVIARYLPASCSAAYRRDAIKRYRWFAHRDGFLKAFVRGACAGRYRAATERIGFRGRRLSASNFERFFRWEEIADRMNALAHSGVRRIAFVDLGKNVYAYYRGARSAGLEVSAIGDDRFAAPGRRYRGIPVVGWDDVRRLSVDAVVVSNSSPVHGTVTCERAQRSLRTPVHHWFPCSSPGDQGGVRREMQTKTADDRELMGVA